MTRTQYELKSYPAGALLQVSQICTNPKTGKLGLIPWGRRNWYRRVASGEIPPGRKMGRSRVWSIEEVLAAIEAMSVEANTAPVDRESLKKASAAIEVNRQASRQARAGGAPSPDQAGPYPAARAPASGASSAHGPKRGPVAEVAA